MKCFLTGMWGWFLCLGMCLGAQGVEAPPALKNPQSLFDGRTLSGWEGNPRIWRVQDGCLTGGSLSEWVKENDFLATTRDYTNFIIRFQIKLRGNDGFINSGFQIRSQRVPNNSEMAGYQCDFGEPSWYGAVYDESRRNKLMAASDMERLRPVIRKEDWNDYVIRAEGSRVTTWINGVMGVDYYEPDLSIPNYHWGKLGIQVHGGGKALVQVKDVVIEELPSGVSWVGAARPAAPPRPSPLSAAEEHATFSLSPGFEVELIASEDIEKGYGKFVAVDWDLQGRLWTMTALEYPVDANESPAVARELYASRAKDKVLVFDRDPQSPTGYAREPRAFAEGLAIPLGMMPYQNGVYVQHGQDIVFLSDTDGDGKADKREVILTGFGVQDSHLFPHQFTRAPGNWIWFAQGAFNYGKVKTTKGKEVQFDQTRMAKFRYDGSDFDITSQGPCNIWGLVLDGQGQAWIQEANDLGYPMMPFHEYANYPGSSQAQWKTYAPEFPATAREFAMGGTGLSGLALTDSHWPKPYSSQFYLANPITGKIQAIQVTPDGPRFRYQKLPDFLVSTDEWFRPVALRNGPDGCLYIVDWYNKIISHNEVSRNHPERDKKRGRIWRVKPKGGPVFEVPDFMRLGSEELVAKLGGASLQQSHMAWQAIGDRKLMDLVPTLKGLVKDGGVSTPKRLAALFALEGLRTVDRETVQPLLADRDRNIRREAVRVYGEHLGAHISDLDPLPDDADPEVRAQVARSAGAVLRSDTAAQRPNAPLGIGLMARVAKEALPEPRLKSTHSGQLVKVDEAYDREFERYVVRLLLEQHPAAVAQFLDSPAARDLPLENRLLVTLALEPRASSVRVAQLLPQLNRPPGDEELLRLAQFTQEPGVGDALKAVLQKPATRTGALESLLRVRTKLDPVQLEPLLTESATLFWGGNVASRALALQLIGGFKLGRLESAINEKLITDGGLEEGEWVPALRALRELGANRLEGALVHVKSPKRAVAEEALATVAYSRNTAAADFIFNRFWSDLTVPQRRLALTGLASTRSGASATVKAVRTGVVDKQEVDGLTFDKLRTVLGNDPEFAALMEEMAPFFRPVLRLNGEDDAWAETGLTLDGPFTVETWVKLDPGIDNNDGIAGVPGALDMNFFAGQFRVWCGNGVHDAIVAHKKTVADVWNHVAVTRDAQGKFRIYLNGELDNADSRPVLQKYENVRIGWTGQSRGTAGWLSEFRIWNRERSASEVRSSFDRSFESDSKPEGLLGVYSGSQWGRLRGGAKLTKTQDFPPLMTAAEAAAMAQKFSRFHEWAAGPGDVAKGRAVFSALCQSCHAVAGQGGQVGPVLNGAGAMGVESLLRNLLTPNAAMEPGYRVFRVELKDGDVLDGIRVSEDSEAIVLRRPNVADTRIAQSDVKRAAFTKSSMMPEGLLDGLAPEQVTDLFAYLKTLK